VPQTSLFHFHGGAPKGQLLKGGDMHKALYRTFRPETFDGLLGQNHIVKILKNQISQGTTGHAYLFCGTRGTGKTSTARILAKGVNCTAAEGDRPCGVCPNCQAIRDGIFLDVIEIDAASNNGVDNIRELRESVNYPPSVGRCKVYIIDEVHMLTTPAFNALLKTLEEPPERVMFLLATTEPQKLPATILSRCLRLDFHRIPEQQMKDGLRNICAQLSVKISDSALGLIAANADGSVRDALSLLDQCISAGNQEVSRDNVLEFLGTSGEEVFIELTDRIEAGDPSSALLLLSRILADGKEVRQFMKDWIAHYRNLLITKYVDDPEELLNMSVENIERIREQSARLSLAEIDRCILDLSSALTEAKWSTQPRILLELCIVRLASAGAPTAGGRPAEKIIKDQDKPIREITILAADEKSAPPVMEPTVKESAAPAVKDTAQLRLPELWKKVAGEAAAEKGSLSMLAKRCELTAVSGTAFTLEISNEIALAMAGDNAEMLERLMEAHTGKKLHIEAILSEKKKDAEMKKTGENLADEIGDLLGIQVDIEEF
jgi:DNA polymerase III subunit gamma/tau